MNQYPKTEEENNDEVIEVIVDLNGRPPVPNMDIPY